jgi:hypothetical protein
MKRAELLTCALSIPMLLKQPGPILADGATCPREKWSSLEIPPYRGHRAGRRLHPGHLSYRLFYRRSMAVDLDKLSVQLAPNECSSAVDPSASPLCPKYR